MRRTCALGSQRRSDIVTSSSTAASEAARCGDVMAWYRGLKMGCGYKRELGKDEARALVSALSQEELADAARQQGMLIWRIGSLHCGSKETLMHARLLARILTLEQYDKMPELERRQLCEELWARAVADSALRRAGGEAAVRLSPYELFTRGLT